MCGETGTGSEILFYISHQKEGVSERERERWKVGEGEEDWEKIRGGGEGGRDGEGDRGWVGEGGGRIGIRISELNSTRAIIRDDWALTSPSLVVLQHHTHNNSRYVFKCCLA